MFDRIEEQFVAAGRTPKGRRALRALFQATQTTLARNGLDGVSLDAIAGAAGLTQAALRHYFPTRDDLLAAFFVSASQWFQAQMTEMLADRTMPAREVLERCIGWHLQFMENVDTAFWLDSASYALRDRPMRRVRDDWYTWWRGQFAALIGQLQPSVGQLERERRAYTMLTLVLGAWLTHGRGSATYRSLNVLERRRLLIDAALDIATQ